MIKDIAVRSLMSVESNDFIILTDVKTRKIIDHNNALLNLFPCSVKGKTLDELIESETNNLISAELRYCDYVESICVESEKCAVSLEQFKASMYICFRLRLTSMNGRVMILTIIKNLGIKHLIPNKVNFI